MKIIITESQLNKIITEARGISKEDYDPKNYRGDNGMSDRLNLVSPKKADGSGVYKSSAQQMRPDAANAFEEMEMAYYNETGKIFGSRNFSDGFRAYTGPFRKSTGEGYGQYDIVDWDYFKETGDFKKRPSGLDDTSKPEDRHDVAEPGTSYHGWGIAADIHGEPQKWMKGPSKLGMETRSHDFGWWWGEVPTEKHHFQFRKKDYDKAKLKKITNDSLLDRPFKINHKPYIGAQKYYDDNL